MAARKRKPVGVLFRLSLVIAPSFLYLFNHNFNLKAYSDYLQGNDKVEIKHNIEEQRIPNLPVDTSPSYTTVDSSKGNIINSDRPYMYIHIGPAKTGTTSIQKFLIENRSILLENDHTECIHIRDDTYSQVANFLLRCVKTIPKEHCSAKYPDFWSNLLNLTSTPARNGRNIVITGEDFGYSDFESKNWKEFLDFHQLQYRIKFVISYRRYFDWLVSDYNQHYKVRGQYSKMELALWPDDKNGLRPRTFPDYYTNRKPDPKDQDKRNYENEKTGQNTNMALVLSDAITKLGIPVKVLNFHDGDVVGSFLCDVLSLKNACEVAKNANKGKHHNPSKDSNNRDLLAVAIRESSLVPLNSTITRPSWETFIFRQMKWKLNWTGFPLTCLEGDQLEEFRRNSYESERILMPTMLSTHDEDFWIAVKKEKFCSIDAPKLIREDEVWRSRVSLKVDPSKKMTHD